MADKDVSLPAFDEKSVKSQEASLSNHEDGEARYLAIMTDHKPDPWGAGYRKLYLFCSLIFLCSTMNGESNVWYRPYLC